MPDFIFMHKGVLMLYRYTVLFLLLSVMFSCSVNSENLQKEQQVLLRQIVSQHFNDLPVDETLLPIRLYEEWSSGRTKTVRGSRGLVHVIPPPPPIDTILYSLPLFDGLGQKGLLTRSEIRYFQESLQQQSYPGSIGAVSSGDSLHILPLSTLPQEQQNQMSYYRVSAPLFNQDYTKALLTVQHHVPGNFYAFRFFCTRQDNQWVQQYLRVHEIE